MSGEFGLAQEEIDGFVMACHGNRAQVEATLRERPEMVHVRSSLAETPLGAASHVGNREIALLLLEHGAELEPCAAIMLGMEDEARAALERDPALVNGGGAHGISPLFHAAIGGQFGLAQLLVERGATLTPRTAGDALHGAIHANHLDMATWLVDSGADLSAPDYQGRTPLEHANATERGDIARMLEARMGGA